MENGDTCQAGTDPDGSCHSDGPGNGQEVPPGIGCSIRPGVPCPETVLIVVMSDGTYLLVGYPQGEPAAFVAGEDADLLRQGLDGAFGKPKGREHSNGNGTLAPGNGALHTEKVQP